MREIRGQLQAERLHFAQSAGEARRAVWRSFGGFWVWLAAAVATGAFLGLLAAYITETAETLFSVEQMARYSCGRPWFGGEVVEQEGGASWCGFWIVSPEQAEFQSQQRQEN